MELESAKSTAEKANLAKSGFLSSMSHELRSPLNAILGFAQLMETATPPPTETQAPRIAQILQAGWHLLKLINEILDLAVIESGKVSLSLEPVALAGCDVRMPGHDGAAGAAAGHSHDLSAIRASGTFVWADRTRLKQIVINLLSNAIKYNKEKGAVVVACTAVGIDRTRISVKDTGAGFDGEKVKQLFQPFNRLGQEAGGVAGTGIGLVVTKQLAELMDGVLGVESTVGAGSMFWIDMLSTAAPVLTDNGVEPDDGMQPRGTTTARLRRLLYVEDNPANMMLVEQLIAQRADIKLSTAVTGLLGIESAREHLPDAILMDINLPGMSGIEALKILRADPATSHIPVVALSANAMLRDFELGLQAGFFRYLTKPIKVKEFTATLNEAFEFAEKSAAPRG